MRTIGMGPIDVVWLDWGVGAGSLIILAGVLKSTERRDHCVAVFRVVVAGRYPVCRFN